MKFILSISYGTLKIAHNVQPNDLVRQSMPFSYFYMTAQSLDGQEHAVSMYSDVDGRQYYLQRYCITDLTQYNDRIYCGG